MFRPEPVPCIQCEERPAVAEGLCAECKDYAQLLKEDVTECPAFLTQHDFQAFMHRLSVHAHHQRPPQAAHIPLIQMEMNLTEAVLQALPRYYVSMLEYTSEERQKAGGCKGGYTFKARLPQEILYKTVEKLGLWKPQDPDGMGV